MKQLTVGEILEAVENIKITTGMTDKEVKALPVYLGDDEELNGIHEAFYYEYISEDNAEAIALIGENSTNKKFAGKALLIS